MQQEKIEHENLIVMGVTRNFQFLTSLAPLVCSCSFYMYPLPSMHIPFSELPPDDDMQMDFSDITRSSRD